MSLDLVCGAKESISGQTPVSYSSLKGVYMADG